jgi:NhaP-type Na+/H+ or K+/H+ antiporter
VTHIAGDIEGSALGSLVAQGVAVAAATIGVRFVWMFVVPQLADLSVIGSSSTNVRERLALAWSGMRGAVSLAAALSIPVDTFPASREHVIFLAYVAVLITLVLPGLTLAPLIERLGLGQSEERRRQEVEARLRLTHAALECLEELAEKGHTDGAVDLLRDRYQARLDRLHDRLHEGGGHPQHGTEGAKAQLAVLEHEREILHDMRRERAFPAELLRSLEAELDVDEARTRSRGR